MKHLFLLYIFLSNALFSFSQNSEIEKFIDYLSQGYVLFSIDILKQSSKKANVVAQFYLAQCYEKGYGVEKDPKIAFEFYRKTAEKGLAVGQEALAICYDRGFGTIHDAGKAAYWYTKAKGRYRSEQINFIDNIYQEGLNHPENYAMNPNGKSTSSGNGSLLAMQNNGSINSNNTIGSNNQTVNNITIVQAAPTQPAIAQTQNPQQPEKPKSDVDQNIPANTQNNENSFALIIANENYQDVAKVPNAINDGEIFAEYCKMVLGLPTSNITLVKDATYNNIKREISKLSQIASAYKGSAKIMFYYAGHGIPNEATKDAFLLPVDGYGTDTSTGYSLKELYSTLANMPAEQIVVLLDACFSGSQRGDGMLASARGVAIKAKPNKTEGKVVVLSAAQGDETAYPYAEEGHGLFTYYLLKKLKDSKGDVSLGDLASYIKDNVSKKSIVVNGKSQTPNVNPSASLGESWKSWTLK